jgi:hypothetical protein
VIAGFSEAKERNFVLFKGSASTIERLCKTWFAVLVNLWPNEFLLLFKMANRRKDLGRKMLRDVRGVFYEFFILFIFRTQKKVG